MEIFFIAYGLIGLAVAAFFLRSLMERETLDPNDKAVNIFIYLMCGLVTLIMGVVWPLVLFGWGFYRLATIGLKR